MSRGHKFYEMQSALAATGQLTDAELAELEQHAEACVACRQYISDMAEMSREFFLLHAGRIKAKGAPAGMQERFLERATGAGILFRRYGSSPFAPLPIRVAVVAVLLAISASLSWRVFSVQNAETRAAMDNVAAEAKPTFSSESNPHMVGETAIHRASISKVRLRQRPAALHNAVSISPGQGTAEESQSDLVPSRSFSAEYRSSISSLGESGLWSDRLSAIPVGEGFHAPTHPFLANTFAAKCFGHDEDCKPEERVYHLDLKLASLSFLGAPESPEARSLNSVLKFSASAFHPAPNRDW
jgi:anti-sigma factor RsiW